MATGNEYNTLTDLLKGIADALRAKIGTTAQINAQDFPSNIAGIPKAAGNASTSDVLSGVTFSNKNGGEQTGAMPNNGTISKSISPGGSYTVPKGYHSGSGTVSANMPSGNAGTGDVLSGKTFSNSSTNGATGTMTNRGAWSTSISPGGSVTIPAGYHNGGGKVSAGGSNPTGVAENGGTGSGKTATVNSTVLCVSGGYSAWDYPNLSLQIKVNGSWIECTSSNGTLAQEGGYGASNGRRHRAKLWYNSGPYRNSIIQEIYAGGVDNDGAVTVLAIKG